MASEAGKRVAQVMESEAREPRLACHIDVMHRALAALRVEPVFTPAYGSILRTLHTEYDAVAALLGCSRQEVQHLVEGRDPRPSEEQALEISRRVRRLLAGEEVTNQ